MKRRSLLAMAGASLAFANPRTRQRTPIIDCGCCLPAPAAPGPRPRRPNSLAGFDSLQSGLKVTGMKVFGVSLTPNSDRPYVFCKLETNQGIVGWGEGTLEGKAGATMACIEDFRDFVMGADPMQVEHIWQSMYVHSFYRAGPVMGSAISAIDQALWDIRGKALGVPSTNCSAARSIPAASAATTTPMACAPARPLPSCARPPSSRASRVSRPASPAYYEWIETRKRSPPRSRPCRCCASPSAPTSISPSISTPRPAPAWLPSWSRRSSPSTCSSSRSPARPENVQAMAKIARRSTTPIATGERLVGLFGCRELIEMGVIDILQTDINHVGGITGLWKVVAMAAVSGDLHGPARLRRAHRRPRHPARQFRHAQLRRPGDLRSDQARPQGQDLGGVARASPPCAWSTAASPWRKSRAWDSNSTRQPSPNIPSAAPGPWLGSSTKTAPSRNGSVAGLL